MASAALFPLLFLVHVVFFMTFETGRWQLLLVDIAAVALAASEFLVSSAKPEFGVLVVVESVLVPVEYCVAVRAFFAKLTLVVVVARVAVHARRAGLVLV